MKAYAFTFEALPLTVESRTGERDEKGRLLETKSFSFATTAVC